MSMVDERESKQKNAYIHTSMADNSLEKKDKE
jgi:hypothetical protein